MKKLKGMCVEVVMCKLEILTGDGNDDDDGDDDGDDVKVNSREVISSDVLWINCKLSK